MKLNIKNNLLYPIFFAIIIIFISLYYYLIKNNYTDNCLIDKSWYVNSKPKWYTSGKMNPKYLIIHHSGVKNVDEIKSVFEEFGLSCHYFIDSDGKVHNIIKNTCGAYHAGTSYWKGKTHLNKSSICIEILTPNPFEKDINQSKYDSLIKLSKDIMKEYNISKNNVLSHSDIAVFNDNLKNEKMKNSNFYNRKQDISYLFNWGKLAENGIGTWYDETKLNNISNNVLYYYGDKKSELIDIKKKLNAIGYKTKINDLYDTDFFMLSVVFHRRFFPQQLILAGQGLWTEKSTIVLNEVFNNMK
ncbi:MAG: N-acetylmuramoyl-L-alanine amidase [Rickettsiales bacterium]|nr:N-acetylmuramoyl-L-alanine amidase [Rickettsiales bacterium]